MLSLCFGCCGGGGEDWGVEVLWQRGGWNVLAFVVVVIAVVGGVGVEEEVVVEGEGEVVEGCGRVVEGVGVGGLWRRGGLSVLAFVVVVVVGVVVRVGVEEGEVVVEEGEVVVEVVQGSACVSLVRWVVVGEEKGEGVGAEGKR